jgi:predicted nucleic acid-binding Zn ribbon protein
MNCSQCGTPTSKGRKTCGAKCLKNFRADLAKRTIAVGTKATHKCLWCSNPVNPDLYRKTCNDVCLQAFRANAARKTIAKVGRAKCIVCQGRIYKDRKTCSYKCLQQSQAKTHRRYAMGIMLGIAQQKKLAHDKALWASRHPVIIH